MIIALQALVFFRESLVSALERLISPYFMRLKGSFIGNSQEDEEDDQEVFAEFDDEKGVVFYPPMYLQRYAAVSDCLIDDRWSGKLEKIVDLGYHDMSFIKYLKEMPGVNCILGVDIEGIPLRCSSDLLGCDGDEYAPKRETPLQVTLFQGNAADPDYRLIGCDAVVAIEMIEHMLPHDLDRIVHTIFGFIKPWITIITTPNADFNILFKSLEKNGLRRLDHFFEWTREQFHDWCSNIVIRYPQFTVTCQGIGPGPPGTQHHGCCSQLALFVNKNYVKQEDLNLNSLALVSDVPLPLNMADEGGWDSSVALDTDQNLYPPKNEESLTDLLYTKPSHLTILFTSPLPSPSFSVTSLEYKDKTSQCNLDTEVGKNFLMFNDEEMCFTILVPRRKVDHKVYEIEDVNSRLNCTTFQVTKFSKPTLNLMAKNKVDSLVHTREVVSEIRHLTKMLNFNRGAMIERGDADGGNIWCNINWGHNAPYWNQYFKIVREYNYPFETKSDESRILDLISEEINRLIESQYDEDYSADVNKLEIPIEHLMSVVRHITTDVDKVKDLLEWNGYEVVNNIVIHSRMVVYSSSIASTEVDWPENETVSDLDTLDVQSTTISDGSNMAPDFHGRCLRRALDKKVRALRTMLSVDEDITTELDHVVCRLMKLALRSSKGKQSPPPSKWMQSKLLDLLTLTEKAISRRRRHYFETFPMKSIEYGKKHFALKMMNNKNGAAENIMDKYNHLIQEVEQPQLLDPLDFGFEDEMGEQYYSSEYFKDFEPDEEGYVPQQCMDAERNNTLDRTSLWVEEDTLEVVPYPDHKKCVVSTLSQNTSKDARHRHPKLNLQPQTVGKSKTKLKSSGKPHIKTKNMENIYKPVIEIKTIEQKDKSNVKANTIEYKDKKSRKRSYSRIIDENPYLDDKSKKSKTNIVKKLTRNKSTSNTCTKIQGRKLLNEYGTYGMKSKRHKKDYKKLQPTASKPIPGSLIELCHPNLSFMIKEKDLNLNEKKIKDYSLEKPTYKKDVAATEESVLVDIIMDDMEETIALCRSIGTDADMNFVSFEEEAVLGTFMNDDRKLQVTSENVESQTIFLYDINEPSTSKGVRHVSMDVQCGTDSVAPYGLKTPCSSVTTLPNFFSPVIKIDSLTNVTSKNDGLDLGLTSHDATQVCSRFNPLNIFTKGIKIGDSTENLYLKTKKSNFGTSTEDNDAEREKSPVGRMPRIKIRDSLSDVKARCADLGTSTQDVADSHETLFPRLMTSGIVTAIVNSESALRDSDKITSRIKQSPTKRHCGIKIKESISDLQSANDSGPKTMLFPDDFTGITGIGMNDSLKNLFACFNPIQSCHTSRSTENNAEGIEIKDSTVNINPNNKADYGTSTFDSVINNTLTPESQSPLVFTRVKMIDLVSDISIEHNTEMKTTAFAPPEPSRVVSPRSPKCTSPGFRCTLKKSFITNPSESYDISTCTYENEENLKYQIHSSVETKHQWIDEHKKNNVLFEPDSENVESINSSTKIQSSQHTVIIQNDEKEDVSRSVLPVTKGFGFKVKDIEDNVIKKVEFSTTRVELLTEGQIYLPPNNSSKSPAKTELIKPVLSQMKMDDATCEICYSNYRGSPQNVLDYPNSCLNTSSIPNEHYLSTDVNEQNKVSPERISERKLSCGGVHIHSYYKEKQNTEDIVYQGEWKRGNPKLLRKLSVNTVVPKRVPNIASRKVKIKKMVPKENITVKKVDVKTEIKKPIQFRTSKPFKTKLEVSNKSEQIKKIAFPNLAKTINKANNKNSTKVASKTVSSSITSKSIRNLHLTKKSIEVAPMSKIKDSVVKPEPVHKKALHRYLPSYLKKNKFATNLNYLNDSTDSKHNSFKIYQKEVLPSVLRSTTAEIKMDLLKMQNESRNINYMIFRNDLDLSSSSANSQSVDNANKTETTKRRSLHKRSSSPISVNSSTCSPTDSVATVKTNSNWSKNTNRRYSNLSSKSSAGNTDCDTSQPVKNKKFTKRSKSNKKADGKDFNNKENIPESSKKCLDKDIKSAFMGRNNNVFMAQFTDSGLTLNGKHQTPNKSNIKIPAVESSEEKKRAKTATISKRIPLGSASTEETKYQDNLNSEASNMVLLLERQQDHVKIHENKSQNETSDDQAHMVEMVDSHLLTEWFESSNISATDRENTENAILAAMRQIVEERLNFINNPIDEVTFVDTRTVNLNESLDLDNVSLRSLQTVVPAGNLGFNDSLKSEIENVMNHSLDAVLGDESEISVERGETTTDADLLSFKSVSSFLVDSDHNEIGDSKDGNKPNSVLDIFERKNMTLVQNPPGNLSIQAFSGYSMNVERVAGDYQPDYINIPGSESLNVAIDVGRQITSEELFVSGRSSTTYESCIVEEEVAVPEWLFNVMNPHLVMNQPSDPVNFVDSETGSVAMGDVRRPVEDDAQELLPLPPMPMPIPIPEGAFDMNGNVMEPGIGLGAGAGDGRGIHSDHSQDSSGRGSSLSSTDSSSGHQSEAILIDPSAFTTQFELFHEPVGSSMAVTTLVVPANGSTSVRQGRTTSEIVSTSRNSTMLFNQRLLLTSDGEADVSSLDTDVPDSS